MAGPEPPSWLESIYLFQDKQKYSQPRFLDPNTSSSRLKWRFFAEFLTQLCALIILQFIQYFKEGFRVIYKILFINLTFSYFCSSFSHANLNLFTSKVRDDYETGLVGSCSLWFRRKRRVVQTERSSNGRC